MNSAHPFSYKETVISGAWHHFRRLLWRWCLRTHSKYINSTSGRKFVTGNGFSDPDFLQSMNMLLVNQYLMAFWAISKNGKLNYAHARKSLPVASPKELANESTFQIWLKSDEKWELYRGHKAKNELTGCKLTRMRVYYFRCYWPSDLQSISILEICRPKNWTLSTTIPQRNWTDALTLGKVKRAIHVYRSKNW